MKIKVLMVEDNIDHILLAKKILKNQSDEYEIQTAETVKEAMKKVSEGHYDIIVSDYNLGGNTAVDFLKAIREKGKDTPFVVVTSAGSEKIAAALIGEGVSDYVMKDDTYREILPTVLIRTLARYNAVKDKEKLSVALSESNKELKKMYQVKSDFTSMVSHELRTPLTAIREGIALVLDGSTGPVNNEQREFLEMAKKNVDRLGRLITDVLDFSKLEAKKLDFRMEEGDVKELIEEIVNIQKNAAAEKGLYLKSNIENNLPVVIFDSDRIIQVLVNLVNNAIKFTDTGGVTISAANDGADNIVVSVQDTGLGIQEEDLPKLFQKFQQLGEINQRRTGGTGLGLAICREIIMQHAGKIWAESVYGQGTVLKFILPIIKRNKILLIDDEKQLLDICAMNLKIAGYNVLLADNGKEGLELAQKERPELIILDIRLDDINGYEFIGRLRSNKETVGIPILVMSGYQDEILKIKDNHKWALPWIMKPFKNDDFIFLVKSLLNK